MRINCPICGPRDLREFYCRGAAVERPADTAEPQDWHAYLHLRDNPAGPTVEFWHHVAGCGAWLRVQRDTVTHAVHSVELAGGDDAG